MQRKEGESYTSFENESDSPKTEAKNLKNRNVLWWKLKFKEWKLYLDLTSSPEKNDIFAELRKAIEDAPPNSSFDEIFNRWKEKEHITPNAKTSVANFHFLAKPRLRDKTTTSENFVNDLEKKFAGTKI